MPPEKWLYIYILLYRISFHRLLYVVNNLYLIFIVDMYNVHMYIIHISNSFNHIQYNGLMGDILVFLILHYIPPDTFITSLKMIFYCKRSLPPDRSMGYSFLNCIAPTMLWFSLISVRTRFNITKAEWKICIVTYFKNKAIKRSKHESPAIRYSILVGI